METVMTKKLEDLLNLPDSKEIIDQSKEEKKESAIVEQEDTIRSIQELDKIQAALPQVKGLGDLGDGELDEVATKSMDAYEDLMDLGMNVESRYSGRIFEVAGQMLKTNLDAKNAKLEKKLKMVELQLKKEKLDKEVNPNGEIVQGEGYIVADRNSILEKLKNMDK
tara:strand:- start:193 stop:690 length:498 start_codon:yes stop_codon:yes gene_type:complete